MKTTRKEAYVVPASSVHTLLTEHFLCLSAPAYVEELEEETYDWES